jgi:cyclohexanone monooxygenase
MIVSIEQHVEWISQCIKHTRESGHTVVEATQDAEEAWVTEVNEVSKSGIGGMIIAHPSCASWYLGANIPGKPRVFMP